jgi:uncharacterized protein YcfJ
MNKSMLIGMVAGIAVATAGGVAGYTLLGQQAPANEQGSVAVMDAPHAMTEPQHGQQGHDAPAARTQPVAKPVPAPAQVVQQECWDEEVTVEVDPKDRHQIAGTAVGAVVGGAVAKDVGDRDLTTAVGAAAGAFIGKKIQQRVQENRAEQRTVTTIERKCAPVGTR